MDHARSSAGCGDLADSGVSTKMEVSRGSGCAIASYPRATGQFSYTCASGNGAIADDARTGLRAVDGWRARLRFFSCTTSGGVDGEDATGVSARTKRNGLRQPSRPEFRIQSWEVSRN